MIDRSALVGVVVADDDAPPAGVLRVASDSAEVGPDDVLGAELPHAVAPSRSTNAIVSPLARRTRQGYADPADRRVAVSLRSCGGHERNQGVHVL
jgi:hypothetical protein